MPYGSVGISKYETNAKKVLALEKEYEASGEAVSREGDIILDKPIVEQYRQILRSAGETVD